MIKGVQMSTSVKSLRAAAFGVLMAVAGAVATTADARPMMGYGGGHGMHEMGMGGHGMGGGRMGERMLDSVNATEAQRTQIRQIMSGAQGDLQKIHDATRALREQQMNLFAQPNVDAAAAEALRAQIQAQHDQASKRRLQAMIDASRVLTPEQRAQLAQRGKERRDMMERHRRERQQQGGARS
jgi:Spy/CpxP family protein refolding chaperone